MTESLADFRGRVLAGAEASGKIVKLTGPHSVSQPHCHERTCLDCYPPVSGVVSVFLMVTLPVVDGPELEGVAVREAPRAGRGDLEGRLSPWPGVAGDGHSDQRRHDDALRRRRHPRLGAASARWLGRIAGGDRMSHGEPKFDGDGNSWSTYNPRSKWDWWALGGRWPNSLALMDGTSGQAESIAEALPRAGVADAALACEVDWDKTEPTFALLDTAGEWHERGHMGWWGIVTDETPADHWEQRWRSLTDLVPPDHTVAVVDVHI